jgi:hypothetical protein
MAQNVQETLMAFIYIAGMAGMFFFAWSALMCIVKAIETAMGVKFDELI